MSALHRRALLQASAMALVGGEAAFAAQATNSKPEEVVMKASLEDAPRGTKGILVRLPDVDLESTQDFLIGRGKWMGKLGRAAEARGAEILRSHGIDPKKPSDMTLREVYELLEKDPLIQRQARFGTENTYQIFAQLRDYFHSKGEYYSNRFAISDKAGPGSLELNPGLTIPDYTRHEFHNQVSGYQGDPFAGMIYFYGTLVLFDGRNEQDRMFDKIAEYMPHPKDGRIRRILDLGCGPGQVATSMKRRFPDAEVWGIDVSGPMVRYAHHRATQMGIGVNFAQRLAEDNKFPDNYFDIIVSSSVHHELTAEASKKVFKEVARTLRPGGVYRPAESGINGYQDKTPQEKIARYSAYRIHHEVWMMEWSNLNRLEAMKDAGIKMDPNGAPGGDGAPWLEDIHWVGTKA